MEKRPLLPLDLWFIMKNHAPAFERKCWRDVEKLIALQTREWTDQSEAEANTITQKVNDELLRIFHRTTSDPSIREATTIENTLPPILPTNPCYTLEEKALFEKIRRELIYRIVSNMGNWLKREPSPQGVTAPFSLEDIEQDENSVTAKSNLYFANWAPDFAHGSDMLIPITELTEKLLKKDEQLQNLQNIRWKNPVKNHLKITVKVNGTKAPFSSEECVSGTFTTNQGRTLSFSAVEIAEDPITRTWNRNAAGDGILGPMEGAKEQDDGVYTLNLEKLPPAAAHIINRETKLRVATVAEVITIATVRTMATIDSSPAVRVMGSLSNMPIPADIQTICDSSIGIKIDKGRIREGKSGMTIIPFQYQLPSQTHYSSGMFATGNDIPKT